MQMKKEETVVGASSSAAATSVKKNKFPWKLRILRYYSNSINLYQLIIIQPTTTTNK